MSTMIEKNTTTSELTSLVIDCCTAIRQYFEDARAEIHEPSPTVTNGDIPTGMVMPFTAEVVPEGWLECDGAWVSCEEYAALYNVIGNRFGGCEDPNRFQLPDLRGEFVRGWDHGRGVDEGRGFGVKQDDEVQEHQHSVYLHAGYHGGTTNGAHGGDSRTKVHGGITGPHGGKETRPRNVALLYCIKT